MKKKIVFIFAATYYTLPAYIQSMSEAKQLCLPVCILILILLVWLETLFAAVVFNHYTINIRF